MCMRQAKVYGRGRAARPAAVCAVLLVCAGLLASCRRSQPSAAAPDSSSSIHKTFERGPVAVDLDVDRATISVADRLHLKITVTAGEDYEVELPAFGENLEQFGIVDYHTAQPVLTRDGKRRVSRAYVLEPFLSGKYKIPPMTVRFWKRGDEKNPHEMETRELDVTVTSLLPEKLAELKIHDIAGPVRMPARAGLWGWVAAAAGLAAGALAVAGLVRRKRRRRAAVQARRAPAHELAFRALAGLIAEDLTARGEFKQFYQRLSDILRRYIENRFGLRAPERTTEEFLEDLRGNESLNREYRALLADFLTHCDLVKFAEHRPVTGEIQKAFDSCKQFITATREQTDAI